MEINITRFVTEAEPFEFSASRAERGQDAAKQTWGNALAEADERPLLTAESELQALRDHMRGFGAWEDEEIASWDADHCNALFIQLISGDLREAESLCDGDGPGGIDWEAYEAGASAGQMSGSMFINGDDVYYSLDY